MTPPLLAALALGIVGSGHCLVMCGPLAAVFAGAGTASTVRLAWRAALYHGGRIAMYALLGGVAGQAGHAASLAGLGRPLAIAAGLALAAIAIGRLSIRRPARVMRAWTRGAAYACGAAGRFARSHPVGGTLGAGVATALLPCGLVYAAVGAAAATGETAAGVLFMMAFGVGTLPALVAMSLAAGRTPRGLQPALQRAAPIVLLVIAALLILRGVAPMTAAGHAHMH